MEEANAVPSTSRPTFPEKILPGLWISGGTSKQIAQETRIHAKKRDVWSSLLSDSVTMNDFCTYSLLDWWVLQQPVRFWGIVIATKENYLSLVDKKRNAKKNKLFEARLLEIVWRARD